MTAAAPRKVPTRSTEKTRHLSASDLEIDYRVTPPPGEMLPDLIPDDDPRLVAVQELLEGFGGVIFAGPPGTSKTWYAAQIGAKLVDRDPSRLRFLQFHPSYQYEDFVEGYAPTTGGGFELRPKHLLHMIEVAEEKPGKRVVLVIDELSRVDPGRVFGEALTYAEKTKRGLKFQLSSGRETSLPDNLIFLATMNPLDRGVDEVDAAFERRFGRIAFDPDQDILRAHLIENGVASDLQGRILRFFEAVQHQAGDNPFARIGHAYFFGVHDVTDLERLWRYQLRFVFEKAYKLDSTGFAEISRAWNRIFQPEATPSPASTDEEPATTGDGA